MDVMELLSVLFRWLHIAAGILWIGLLYFFNFAYLPFAGTMDAETRRKVAPGLLARGLYFFRWAAVYTWVTGLLLLMIVFYHGGLMFEQGTEAWTAGSFIMIAVVFLAFVLYDVLAKSALGKKNVAFALVSFVIIGVIVYLMVTVGSFGYRAYLIHTGVMFGTIMTANVWMRIWPGQKKVLSAIKEGTAPDANLLAAAQQRSRHNTFLSVPLIWTMINVHTTTTIAVQGWYYLLVVVALGWLVVAAVYKKAAKVKEF